jgi:uncharacterized Zn-binding protein involved in type VI secretion
MPKGPAARLGDNVAHPLPPVLTGGTGSPTVLIGGKPAWRGVPAAAAQALDQAKQVANAAIKTAEAATAAAAGSPGEPDAKAAELTTKTTTAASMAGLIAAAGAMADIHSCETLLPPNPHGVGVVVNGSQTVTINGLPACRLGDTIVESIGPPNTIALGEPTVNIGG